MQAPQAQEHPPGFGSYISLATSSGRPFDELLARNTKDITDLFGNIPAELHEYRYADGKWNTKEVLMHLIDTERVFAYRALVCIRGDADTPMHPIDENLYAANADVSKRTMSGLVSEFEAVRRSTVFLFEGITEAQSRLLGNFVPGKISARALGFAIAGHAMHHINIMHERYLTAG